MKNSQNFFENWRFWKMAILKNGHFGFFWLITMKISRKSCDRMDGTHFWCFSEVSGKYLAIGNITLYSVPLQIQKSALWKKIKYMHRIWILVWGWYSIWNLLHFFKCKVKEEKMHLWLQGFVCVFLIYIF